VTGAPTVGGSQDARAETAADAAARALAGRRRRAILRRVVRDDPRRGAFATRPSSARRAAAATRRDGTAPGSAAISCSPGGTATGHLDPKPHPVTTEIATSPAELGPTLTRVIAERWGWEKLTGGQLDEEGAMPRGDSGGAFRRGWAHIQAASQLPRKALPGRGIDVLGVVRPKRGGLQAGDRA
jgi:hypothetical protein